MEDFFIIICDNTMHLLVLLVCVSFICVTMLILTSQDAFDAEFDLPKHHVMSDGSDTMEKLFLPPGAKKSEMSSGM